MTEEGFLSISDLQRVIDEIRENNDDWKDLVLGFESFTPGGSLEIVPIEGLWLDQEMKMLLCSTIPFDDELDEEEKVKSE